jgi:hypothetical protein
VVVESPGFTGGAEQGYRTALESLKPKAGSGCSAVNIDGISLLDPFARGNLHEMQRLLSLAGAGPGTVFCLDRLDRMYTQPRSLRHNRFASEWKDFGLRWA